MATYDVVIVGGGHNGLVSAIVLAAAGRKVLVLEEKSQVGGACKTEYPFKKAPKLGTSSGAYLLGLMPPEIIAEIGVDLPLKRRDPHYFLPTTGKRYVMFGSDQESTKRQLVEFFSQADYDAHVALNREVGQIRDDIARTWLEEPLSIEETAEKYVRAELRKIFVGLCRGSISEYLDRFGFKSDLIKAMYAVTDAFSGLSGGFDTPGTGMNFLIHNMCRLPGADGTWMIVEGGMGAISERLASKARSLGAEIRCNTAVARIERTGNVVSGVALANGETISTKAVVVNADPYRARDLVGKDALAPGLSDRLDSMRRDGSTFKVNLALSGLPQFTCLPEDRGQFGPTIHLMPDEDVVIDLLRSAHKDAMEGRLPDFPSIEWYFHTPIDPSLKDDHGHHNSALFVEWVPLKLADGSSWEDREAMYANQLLSICDRFAPGTSDLVVDMFPLSPAGIEKHFGITHGHIHHIDNGFGFADRVPHRLGPAGLYSASAGTHPAGSVIGAAGYIAAKALLADQKG
jgi:phytoene dehydrogenase-like protein